LDQTIDFVLRFVTFNITSLKLLFVSGVVRVSMVEDMPKSIVLNRADTQLRMFLIEIDAEGIFIKNGIQRFMNAITLPANNVVLSE
jgi:hypothetical protein